MSWILVTGNESKFREARAILDRPLERIALELPEIQAANVRDVALAKAKAAYEIVKRPVIVEDAGFELVGLGGFPGPYIKYWEQLGGLASICRAADGLADRAAAAVCVLAVCDEHGPRIGGEGRIAGRIPKEPRGTNGFGWDAIFVPAGDTRTFAEMSAAEKSAISHRRRAWDALARS